MTDVNAVAERIRDEVGLSQTASRRVAKKLEELAESVDWAIPLSLFQRVQVSLDEEKNRAEAAEKIVQESIIANKVREQFLQRMKTSSQTAANLEALKEALARAVSADKEKAEAAERIARQTLAANKARAKMLQSLEERKHATQKAVSIDAIRKALMQGIRADEQSAEAVQEISREAWNANKARAKILQSLRGHKVAAKEAVFLDALQRALSQVDRAEKGSTDAAQKMIREAWVANKARADLLEAAKKPLDATQNSIKLRALQKALAQATNADKERVKAAREMVNEAYAANKARERAFSALKEQLAAALKETREKKAEKA